MAVVPPNMRRSENTLCANDYCDPSQCPTRYASSQSLVALPAPRGTVEPRVHLRLQVADRLQGRPQMVGATGSIFNANLELSL